MHSYKKGLLWSGLAMGLALGGCAGAGTPAGKVTYASAESFMLDPVAKTNIYETPFSISLPVELLVTVEQVSEEGVQIARKMADGTRGKRKPINVTKRGDGTFSIIDGNRTYTMMRGDGARTLPVVISFPYTKDVKDASELIRKNELARGQFTTKAEEFRQALGGALELSEGLPSLGEVEARNKAQFQGNPGGVTDILNGRLVLCSAADMGRAIAYAKGRRDLMAIDDRWATQAEDGSMDAIAYLVMDNAVVGQLRITCPELLAVGDIADCLQGFVSGQAGNHKLRKVVRRVAAAKRQVIRAAAAGKGEAVDALRPQFLAIGAGLAKAKDKQAAEPLAAQLEALIAGL